MTAKATRPADTEAANNRAVTKTGRPPYPFRTITALILLAGNLLVAGIYFHVINP